MYKTLLQYTSFTAATIVVVGVFVTSTTYTQLSLAIFLYPLLVLLAYYTFLSGNGPSSSIKPFPVQKAHTVSKKVETVSDKMITIEISDSKKREFLKLIGATGISFVLYSIFSKKLSFPLHKTALEAQSPSYKGSTENINGLQQPYPIEEYRISEVDDNIVSYYGFVHRTGGWYIMKQDTVDGTFRYSRGDSGFSKNWVNRKKLKYIYYDEAFKP